jgi:hypothetical protein
MRLHRGVLVSYTLLKRGSYQWLPDRAQVYLIGFNDGCVTLPAGVGWGGRCEIHVPRPGCGTSVRLAQVLRAAEKATVGLPVL